MSGNLRKRAKTSKASGSTSTSTAPPAKKCKTQSAKQPPSNITGDKKITEFFPIRKSNRITGKALEIERMRHLEEIILSGSNEADLQVAICGDKGRGLIALRRFARNEFVVEYKGDIVDYAEAVLREAKYAEDPSIGSYMYFFKFGERRMCVDATAETPFKGRLLNHSVLKPNLRPKVLDFGHFVCVGLYALRDIEEGEELLYDYGDRTPLTVERNPWLMNS
ncbi:[Histone H4]-lysine(20) N-methyltransferase [Aphelenchoides besseyi]|nr:[Histone H4]-lysine(20) N-methyltransferase [Aphelenchoides besseyi]KAI6209711.1 [Histone H4]-lysine(20) N-methyltransferase [Aphelenchoides besseyi]